MNGAFIPCRDGTISISGCPSIFTNDNISIKAVNDVMPLMNFLSDSVKDSDFTWVPDNSVFEDGPTGTDEVHTQILRLNLVPRRDCSGSQSALAVRAGFEEVSPGPLDFTPRSIGEVESINSLTSALGSSKQGFFPAESFFNMFVHIDMDFVPADGTVDAMLYNLSPLVIQQDSLDKFPPQVVYVHGGGSNHPMVYDKSSGDAIGWLTLAGHGIGYYNFQKSTCASPLGAFQQAEEGAANELAVTVGALNETDFKMDFALTQMRLDSKRDTPLKLEPYWKYALSVPNPDANDVGVLYITNTSEATISPIYGTLYSKGVPIFENKKLLSLGPLESMNLTSAELAEIAGTSWGGRGLMKIGCSASDSGCTPDAIKFMMTGRRHSDFGGGPLVDLTAEVTEMREGGQGIFTLLGIFPPGGDVVNVRINNISAGSITVEVKMYDGYGDSTGTKDYSIGPHVHKYLSGTKLFEEIGPWNDENTWLQVITNTPAGVTRVQYYVRNIIPGEDVGILSNVSVGSGQQ